MSNKSIQTQTHFDVKEKVWRGLKKDIESGSDVSLGQSLIEALLKHPDHTSQICDNNGKEYTDEDIATMSIRVAQHLQELGMQQEDIIGICASNTDFLAPLVIGALLSGVILSTLDPTFDKDGIRHIFSITQPKLMFCDGKVYDKVKAALAEVNLSIPVYTMKDHLKGVGQIQELIAATGKEKSFKMEPLKMGSGQTAAIICSSGTTGLPKGVCASHESLLNARIFNLSLDDKLLCYSTIYWASGLLSLIQGSLNNCTRVITDQVYSPRLFLRMVEQHKINVAFTPPSQMAMTIQEPDFKQRNLSSLELYICGGSAVPFAVVQDFAEHVRGCEIIVGYGMSEISGACTFGPPVKSGATGQLMSNFEVKIIDESDKRLGICERGEICVKPPHKWAGYYNNQVATKAIYDQEGWISSGDIGYFDDQGFLFIVDRKKDILKYNNFHFFPTEIEEVIVQIPDVVEVCVCGIPDIISSFLPAAAVVKVPNSKLTENDVSNYVAERMAHFKHLRGGVYFLDSLPKTASGKNIRAKVTQLLEELWHQRKPCNESTKKHSNVTVSA